MFDLLPNKTITMPVFVYRDVKFSVSFPKTVFRYWSSQAEVKGVECSIEKAELSLSFNLALLPVDSDLIQRHRANWTVSSFSGCGQGINAHIKRSMDPQDLTEASAMKVMCVVYSSCIV